MNPWDQLPGESNAAYAHFLTYRNLGPSRSLDTAYQVTKSDKTLQAPGNWANESTRHNWTDRAAAWDINMLQQHGERVVTSYVKALERIAVKALEALEDDEVGPNNWRSALAGIELLSRIVSGEAASALYAARSRPADEPPALNAPRDADDVP